MTVLSGGMKLAASVPCPLHFVQGLSDNFDLDCLSHDIPFVEVRRRRNTGLARSLFQFTGERGSFLLAPLAPEVHPLIDPLAQGPNGVYVRKY